MATSDLAAPPTDLSGLLSALIGTKEDQDTNKDVKQTDTSSSVTNGTQANSSTSANNSTTSNSSTNTNSSKTTSDANIGDLQQVFNKQIGGITPEMLSAIFTEGAKAVPGLITAQANAVGARASDNTPLATSLTDLQAKLTGQAATINQQMLADSASTAANIANLTKGSTTTGTNVTTGDQNTKGTQITNGTQSNSGTTNSAQTSDQKSSQNLIDTKAMDPSNVKLLAALGLGGSAINSLLGGGSGGGGLNQLLQAITGVGANGSNSLLGTLKGFMNGGTNPGYQPGGNYAPTSADLKALYGDAGYTGTATVGSDEWYKELASQAGLDTNGLGDALASISDQDNASTLAGLLSGGNEDDAASILADMLGG